MNVVLVFLGGGLGATARWYFTSGISSEGFPFGTLAVNLIGCLLIGLIGAVVLDQPKTGLLLVTGFLGGFTTFSSFGLDAFGLLQLGEYKKFLSYVVLSNLGGVLLVVLGYKIASSFIG